jgi:hypothetical protein
MAEQPLNSMWLAARPTLISGKIFKQKQSGAHPKLRMAHLLAKSGSSFMLASSARPRARATQRHTLLPARQQRQTIYATSVNLIDRLYRNNRQQSLLKVSNNSDESPLLGLPKTQ